MEKWVHVLHLISAVTWVGGTIFIAAVAMPSIRKFFTREQYRPFLMDMGRRFRIIGWVCLALLVVTGLHKIRYLFTADAVFDIGNSYYLALLTKLVLVGMAVVLAAVHDFFLGPAVGRETDPARIAKLVAVTRILAMVQLMLMVAIVVIAALLRAGVPELP